MPPDPPKPREPLRVRRALDRPVRELREPIDAKGAAWKIKASGRPSFFIDRALATAIVRQAEDGSRAGHEVLGLLVGDRLRAYGGSVFSVALDRVTAPLEASAGHVRFHADKFNELARALDLLAFDYLLVGWYHSHLGVGCFMSSTDLTTHARYFAQPHQFALVVDAVRGEAGAFQLREGKGVEVPFALFENGQSGNPEYRLAR